MKRNNFVDKLKSTFLKADLFGEKAEIQVKGESSYHSCFGAFISILIMLLTFAYGIQKFKVMLNFEDTKV